MSEMGPVEYATRQRPSVIFPRSWGPVPDHPEERALWAAFHVRADQRDPARARRELERKYHRNAN